MNRALLFRKLLILFFLFNSIYAGELISDLRGVVLDGESHEKIPNAVIHIMGKDKYFTTNLEGEFTITGISENILTLEINHLAYKENIVKINIHEQKNENVVVYLVPKSIEINPVVVTDYQSFSKLDDLQELSNVLKGKELQRELGLTLASTLKNETGLAIRSMGPAPARPVIRGLGSDRVFISEDGNKTIDLSATSPDHAVTVDPFNLDRIEVWRGPKVLLKTPTTIGGVVNVVRHEIPEKLHSHILGSIGAYGETANGGYLGSSVLEIPIDPLSIKAEISRRKAFDLHSPIGRLHNSYSENLNYNFAGSYITDFGFIGASYRSFILEYGVPGGFVGAHPKGVDIEMYRKQLNVKGKIYFASKIFDNLEFHFSRVLYRHKEFEASGNIGSEFKIISYLGYVNLTHNNFLVFERGTSGVSFEYRDFNIGGFVFTSPTKSLNVSAYIYEIKNLDRFTLEFGARYNLDKITPEKEKTDAKIGHVRERIFNTYSISFTTLFELTKIVYMGINISKSSRVPTIEELYSEGPHLAAYSYETGNPALNAESGFGAEFFVYHKFKNLYWNLNIFRNDLNSYIIPRNSGEVNFQTFLPIYKTSGVHALLYGIENQVIWKPYDYISLSSSVSFTRGNFMGSDNSLPQIPPVKGRVEVQYINDIWSVGINAEWAGDQNNVDQFEKPTNGYTVFNSFAQYSFTSDHLIHTITLNIDNIFNTKYRNHLSRVKSILPEAGLNFRATYKLHFNI